MIPYGRQSLDDEDIEAVVDTLRSDFLTQGPKTEAFENAVSGYCGATHAIAVNSATSALHIACLSLEVGQGDVVWTSPVSFVASANCARYCGARVDFVDIEMGSGNICLRALEAKLLAAEQAGKLPKVLVVVHFAGQPCAMEKIHAFSLRYGFHIVEDAAHAVGAYYQGRPTGSCQYSDITVFSFHPVKVITSAEGGMALTNSDKLAARMRLLASHGVTRDPALMQGEPEGEWAYHQITLGFNYRISDVHAALGISQMRKLDNFVARRNELAQRYDRAFDGTGVRPLQVASDSRSSYHLYTVLLPESVDRQECFRVLRAEGVGVHVHYIPVYKQPYYRALGFDAAYCPNAEHFYRRLLTLPLFPSMQAKEIDMVIDKVVQALSYDPAAVQRSKEDC